MTPIIIIIIIIIIVNNKQMSDPYYEEMDGYCEVNHSPCIIVCTIAIREGVGLYMLPGDPRKDAPVVKLAFPVIF